MSHLWMSHVTHMHVSWHTYEWVLLQIWMKKLQRSGVCTCEWVMWLSECVVLRDVTEWMRCVTRMDEVCHVRMNAWLLSHVCMRWIQKQMRADSESCMLLLVTFYCTSSPRHSYGWVIECNILSLGSGLWQLPSGRSHTDFAVDFPRFGATHTKNRKLGCGITHQDGLKTPNCWSFPHSF